ncbi:hypothetical protein RRG08_002411 [Elysia crispata]|uniref:Uncharacterized protein n=1 Tax=Elysia crispata TaxID=231223 RepID=A0AAE0ZG63_9GAST|nr:hypothetical protein RRG08_002411 [Elysia crispata]
MVLIPTPEMFEKFVPYSVYGPIQKFVPYSVYGPIQKFVPYSVYGPIQKLEIQLFESFSQKFWRLGYGSEAPGPVPAPPETSHDPGGVDFPGAGTT